MYSLDLLQPIIVAVTGHTETIYTEKALNSGMNIVLFKPANPVDVNNIV